MTGSVNKVILVGNLARDPEPRQTNDGREFVNFTLATSEVWKDQHGERRERPEWHRVVIFDQKICEVARRFLKKGRKVYLEGQLQTRKWTDQQGVEKYTTEIVLGQFRGVLTMLDSRSNGSGYGGGDSYSRNDGSRSDDYASTSAQSLAADSTPTQSVAVDDFGDTGTEINDDIPF